MVKKQIVREQRAAKTAVEKLFKMAVEKLFKIWKPTHETSGSEYMFKLKQVIHGLRVTKLFPVSAFDELEKYFKDTGYLYVEIGGHLLFDSSDEIINLLPVLDDETEYKLIKDAWMCFYASERVLNKLVLNPCATLKDMEMAFMYGATSTVDTIYAVKNAWNKEVEKANDKPVDLDTQNRYAFIVRCLYARSGYSKAKENQRCLDKKFASELYRMNGFNRNLISAKELAVYKKAQQKSK